MEAIKTFIMSVWIKIWVFYLTMEVKLNIISLKFLSLNSISIPWNVKYGFGVNFRIFVCRLDWIFELIQDHFFIKMNYCVFIIFFRAFTLHVEKCVKTFGEILTLLVIPEKGRRYLKCSVGLSVYSNIIILVMF